MRRVGAHGCAPAQYKNRGNYASERWLENLCQWCLDWDCLFPYCDQPWLICDFEPTPAFEAYRPIFDEYARLVNDDSIHAAADEISDFYEMRIESLNLDLQPSGDNWVWETKVFVAQIYDGSEAVLRPM